MLLEELEHLKLKTRLIGEMFANVLLTEIVVYYESLKRDLKTKTIYGFRCNESLKTKVEESTLLGCTLIVYYESVKQVFVCLFKQVCLLRRNKARAKQKTYKSVGVMKD